jgi:hypothetical protein
MNTVYVVTGHGETWVFEDERQAEQFAGVRGGCEWETCDVIGEHDANLMIVNEAKDRRDEDRMRQAGL